MLGSTEPLSRTRRRRTKGLVRLRNKREYRQKRQSIKRKSKQWRRLNKSKIKRYERRRRISPQLHKLLRASVILDHPIFDVDEDVSLREREITFWDLGRNDLGFVDWIDLDGSEIHTAIVHDDERTERVYDIYDFMDRAVLLYEDDEEILLGALDEAAAPESDADETDYDYDRRDPSSLGDTPEGL